MIVSEYSINFDDLKIFRLKRNCIFCGKFGKWDRFGVFQTGFLNSSYSVCPYCRIKIHTSHNEGDGK
jgi:hypothetical protein